MAASIILNIFFSVDIYFITPSPIPLHYIATSPLSISMADQLANNSPIELANLCITSVYKLISVVHAAILYDQRLPIDELYIRTTDKHIYKYYARLYYVVTGEYLYCDKLTFIVGRVCYNERADLVTTCWPRYWLIEIGTFDVICGCLPRSMHVKISNNSIEVCLADTKDTIYSKTAIWYGANFKHLPNSFPDLITLEKASLPMPVCPKLFTASDMEWYDSRYKIYVDKKKLSKIVSAIMSKNNSKAYEYDELYIRKDSKFRANCKKNEYNQMHLIQQIASGNNVRECLQ